MLKPFGFGNDATYVTAEVPDAILRPVALSRLIIRSIGWSAAARFTTVIGSALRTILFARLLTPYDFGVFGAALAAQTLLRNVTNPSLSRALVPQQESMDQSLDTVWTALILQNLVVALVLVLGAQRLAAFLRVQEWTVFIALAPLPILMACGTPAIVERIAIRFDFRTSCILNVGEQTMGLTVGLFAMLWWRNWRALVMAAYAAQLAQFGLAYYYYPYWPKLKFDLRRASGLFSFGRWVMVRKAVRYGADNLDSMVVGHLLGPLSLGSYQIAKKVAKLPTFEVSQPVADVAYPLGARIRHDRKHGIRFLLLTNGAAIVIGVLYAFAIARWGSSIVVLVVGRQWMSAVKPLEFLCLFGAGQALLAIGIQFLDGANAPRAGFEISTVNLLVLSVLIVPLTRAFQATGTAMAMCLSMAACVPFLVVAYDRVLSDD
jgi:O-antigen/teichoic acid export membrane protein